MRAVVQRVSQASVTVTGEVVGRIETGLLVLVGVAEGDQPEDAIALAEKLTGLRIFPDGDGKMNLSVLDIGGGVLVVSQFTLLGDCRKGRRPSFVAAAEPTVANRLYELLVSELRGRGVASVATGRFQTHMDVSLTNDGPVTLLLDSKKAF